MRQTAEDGCCWSGCVTLGQLLRCDDVAAESGVVDKAASWGVGGCVWVGWGWGGGADPPAVRGQRQQRAQGRGVHRMASGRSGGCGVCSAISDAPAVFALESCVRGAAVASRNNSLIDAVDTESSREKEAAGHVTLTSLRRLPPNIFIFWLWLMMRLAAAAGSSQRPRPVMGTP